MDIFTDDESRQLLRLLHKYVMAFAPDIPQTISALAEDLAMSMDRTTAMDDLMRFDIVNAEGVT